MFNEKNTDITLIQYQTKFLMVKNFKKLDFVRFKFIIVLFVKFRKNVVKNTANL